ncbi:MAG TPA: radical SAM protein [Desulfatiglandales bacterium]|nr:radical SAM protein [Desulfatiglandales bacterium]
MKVNFAFEQGPIRPPSEAKSLLIRATRNCPWNKCAFCHTYRGSKFGMRSVKEIKDDIQRAKDISDRIREMSQENGEGGEVTEFILSMIFNNDNHFDDSFRSIAAWLYFGGESVFIQDANSIIMKTDDLVEVLSFIRDKFPCVKRITSYCRSNTASRKSVEDFKRLHKAGLSRIHIGMETGYDPLLTFIRKGVTASEHIEGGKKIRASGISLSEYVIPGLGGEKWTKEHAEETAKVLNQINPQFIRFRTLQVRRDTELYEMMKRGEFKPIGDEDILREIKIFIESLDGIESTIVSDHILNLLEELEGTLPEDKGKLIAIIDRYFSLSEKERAVFRLGRRRGLYRKLDDLSDARMYDKLQSIVEQYWAKDQTQLDRDLCGIMHNYI